MKTFDLKTDTSKCGSKRTTFRVFTFLKRLANRRQEATPAQSPHSDSTLDDVLQQFGYMARYSDQAIQAEELQIIFDIELAITLIEKKMKRYQAVQSVLEKRGIEKRHLIDDCFSTVIIDHSEFDKFVTDFTSDLSASKENEVRAWMNAAYDHIVSQIK